jgi:4-amino-4-deoxy-L-arabinose transferase-like glycosyltransferase
MRSKRAQWAALAGVLVLAAVLRIYNLENLPAGLYCDEAGNGYNAYALGTAGIDENGRAWPLYVWSFGTSYKNPAFIYAAILPIKLLGLSAFSVRLTAALFGIATVAAMFFLGRALLTPWAGFWAALFLALCPWHLHFSRIAFELVTMPFFVVLGVTDLVRFGQGRRTLARAALFFAIALYTYVPAQLFVPLLLAGFAFVYFPVLRARRREALIAAVVFAAIALPLLHFDLTHREQSSSYFRHASVLSRELPPLELAGQVAANYTAFFTPRFLLYRGGDRILRHQVRGHGMLYPCFGPLLLAGIAVVLTRRDRAMALPLLWLVLYPVAGALMNEIPSATRGFIGAAGFCLLAAMGAGAALRAVSFFSARRTSVLALQGMLVTAEAALLASQASAYWQDYTVNYPHYSAKFYTGFQFGNRQVVDYFRRHYDEYDDMVLSERKSNMADVFLRFWDGLARPPRQGVMPPFEHSKKMRVGFPDDLPQYDGTLRLFAVLPEELPLFDQPVVKERVIAPDGSEAFVIAEARGVKDFVTRWRVAGPYEPEEATSPPEVEQGAGPRAPGGIRWRVYRRPTAGVDLNDFFSPDLDFSCAWAVNFAHSDTEREVEVWAGFDDTGEVWINGERAPLDFRGTGADSLADSQVGRVRLRAGANAVEIRSCDELADWKFYFRVASLDGGKVDGVRWEY